MSNLTAFETPDTSEFDDKIDREYRRALIIGYGIVFLMFALVGLLSRLGLPGGILPIFAIFPIAFLIGRRAGRRMDAWRAEKETAITDEANAYLTGYLTAYGITTTDDLTGVLLTSHKTHARSFTGTRDGQPGKFFLMCHDGDLRVLDANFNAIDPIGAPA